MIFLLWTSIFLLIHTYLLYSLSLVVLGWFFRKKQEKIHSTHYKVSMIFSAYNEERIIEDKIKNCFELDYPHEKLEVIIGSDGSTDTTNELVKRSPYKESITFVEFRERRGKSAVLNRLTRQATGDIILFCDANTMLHKNAVKKLLSNFYHDGIGCVCGRLKLNDSTDSPLGRGESIYWNMESGIKKLEGKLGIVLGANGGIYAIRRELYQQIPEDRMVMDDFFITNQVLMKGKRAVYEPLAIGSEETSADSFGEFNRKVRIGQANFNLIATYIKLLNPRFGLVAYSFLSHKLLRWLGPILLLLIFILNAAICFSPSATILYWFMLLGQCLFALMALPGFFRSTKGKKIGVLFNVPFYFLSMNYALFLGMLKAFSGERGGMWERVARTRTT